ncbi:hypothetical protein FRC12_010407, partial [Ceratobasidium sp. 428]
LSLILGLPLGLGSVLVSTPPLDLLRSLVPTLPAPDHHFPRPRTRRSLLPPYCVADNPPPPRAPGPLRPQMMRAILFCSLTALKLDIWQTPRPGPENRPATPLRLGGGANIDEEDGGDRSDAVDRGGEGCGYDKGDGDEGDRGGSK